MTKLKITICTTLLFISILTSIADAAFNDIGIGARPLGLGGAFVALADDGNAANYNAAGLGYIDDIQLHLTTVQRFKGLITYHYISGALPLGAAGALGTSFGNLSEDSGIYHEQTLRLSYAKAFSQFALGVNVTSLETRFDQDNEFVKTNPYFANTSASAFSLGVGAIVKPVKELRVGFSADNLIPADVSISESEADNVPVNIRFGLAYSLSAIAETTQQESLRKVLKSGIGLIEIGVRDGNRHLHAGAEVFLNKTIGVRAGYALASGINSTTTIALGGSVKIPVSAFAVQLDYGFQILSGDFKDNTTQQVSLNLVF